MIEIKFYLDDNMTPELLDLINKYGDHRKIEKSQDKIEKKAKAEPKVEDVKVGPSITLDTIMSAATPLVETKLEELRALSKEFGVATIQDLKPEQFEDYYNRVIALGGV